MKYGLFAVALLFAAIFVMSSLFGFAWNIVGLLNGNAQEELTAIQSYYATGVGLVGWIITSLALVMTDELDGENPDDELVSP